jgi:hypothetical protein
MSYFYEEVVGEEYKFKFGPTTSPISSFGNLDLPDIFSYDPSDDAFIKAVSLPTSSSSFAAPLPVECSGCSMYPFCAPRFNFLLGYPAGDHSPTLPCNPCISFMSSPEMTTKVVSVKKVKKAKNEKVFTVHRVSNRLLNAAKNVNKPTKGESWRLTSAIIDNSKAKAL